MAGTMVARGTCRLGGFSSPAYTPVKGCRRKVRCRIHIERFDILDKRNIRPDYRDPDWVDNVTDWYQFWNHDNWLIESEQLDDMDQVDAWLGRKTMRAKDRMRLLAKAIQKTAAREDIVHILPISPERQYFIPEETHPTPVKIDRHTGLKDKYAPLSLADLRAKMEKRKKKALLDAEWRKRQSWVGRVPARDKTKDLRFMRKGEKTDWTHEEIMNVITHNGISPTVDQMRFDTENPLANADYPANGAHHIEETEDFLVRIGRMGLYEHLDFGTEVELTHDDVTDFDGLIEAFQAAPVDDEGEGEAAGA